MPTSDGKKLNAPLHLITGAPGTGKTTAMKVLASALSSRPFSGFYTEEMRESGQRVGFRAITFGGQDVVLAHVSFRSGPRVGKYRVDLPTFEETVVPEIDPTRALSDLFLMDEIGKMECFSDYFVRCVREIRAENRGIVATVAIKGGGLIREIKETPGATLHKLDRSNRERLPYDIVNQLSTWVGVERG